MGTIGLWFYRNEGGAGILARLEAGLRELGHDVYSAFDMRRCRVENGRVFTEDGRDLSGVDVLYNMNADQQSEHQREVLQALEHSGVRLVNTAASFDRAQDKFWANGLLRGAGVPVAESALVPTDVSLAYLESLFDRWPAVVAKKRRGHGGYGIQKFDTPEALHDYLGAIKEVFANVYLEAFVRYADCDIRVELIGGEFVGGYGRRRAHRFKTNVHLGARMVPTPPDDSAIGLARRAAGVLGLDCTIVDMVVEEATGQTFVIEANPFLGIFTKAALEVGVNTVQRIGDAHEVFAYDDRKLDMLTKFLHRCATGVDERRA